MNSLRLYCNRENISHANLANKKPESLARRNNFRDRTPQSNFPLDEDFALNRVTLIIIFPAAINFPNQRKNKHINHSIINGRLCLISNEGSFRFVLFTLKWNCFSKVSSFFPLTQFKVLTRSKKFSSIAGEDYYLGRAVKICFLDFPNLSRGVIENMHS